MIDEQSQVRYEESPVEVIEQLSASRLSITSVDNPTPLLVGGTTQIISVTLEDLSPVISSILKSQKQWLIKEEANSVQQVFTPTKQSSAQRTSQQSWKSPSPSPCKKINVRSCDIHLIEGEDLFANQQCLMLVDSENRSSGYILVTNYRVMFVQNSKVVLDLPLGYAQMAERMVEQKPVTWSRVQITTKYGRVYRFRFTTQLENSNKVYRLVKKSIQTQLASLFAFPYAKAKGRTEVELPQYTSLESWKLQVEREYERMGVATKEANCPFKWVDNLGGKLCLSYPPQFIVTKKVKDDTLMKCLKTRTRERVPLLSYFHKERKTEKTACLWRAAQCKSSSQTSRNYADQQYIRCLDVEEVKQKSQMLLVYDIRTKAVSQTGLYQNCLVRNVNDLLSLLLLRESYVKIANISPVDHTSKFISQLEDSKWYEQVCKLLNYAEEISLKMKNGNPVLIQCQQGLDRSAQLSTLVQLMLCPFYRTIEGLTVLITKEFTWMGYPYADRLRSADDQRVPSLVQLLDCIHQLCNMFPLSFQFTSRYLSKLADCLYTNLYGNFICNNYIEFINRNINSFTLSFWQRSLPEVERNPYYLSAEGVDHLLPLSAVGDVRIWGEYFFNLGSRETDDQYRINPEAESNRDYLILNHWSVKQQNFQFKVLVREQEERIEKLRKQLEGS